VRHNVPLEPSPNLADDTSPKGLPRCLSGWSATSVVVGLIIGSGIFRVPSSIAAEAGSVAAIAALWLLGGLVVLCGALSLAELATMFPRAGGQYVFLRETYGRPVAFLYGWTFLLVSPTTWAAVALIFAGYLGTFIQLTEREVRLVAALLIVLVGAANYRSVRVGASIQNVSTAAKVLALLAVAATVFIFGRNDGAFAAPSGQTAGGWSSLGIAFIGVLFAYGGWAEFLGLAGEVREPGRNLPLALGAGTAIVILIYLLVNAAYLFVLPVQAVAASNLVAADAMTQAVGGAGASIVAALVMLSTFGALSGMAMAFPRVFYAMAEDKVFFHSIAAVHPRFLTPHGAIAFSAGLAVLYVSIRTFEQLAEALIIGTWPFDALLVVAVFVLRRTRPDLPRPYRTFGYPWVPLIFLLASMGLLTSALVEHPQSTLLSLGITLLGIPVFFVWRVFSR
jgi:basic amino acid/polyamine antiporter, APA family